MKDSHQFEKMEKEPEMVCGFVLVYDTLLAIVYVF
jgi:hypothetical protein